MLLQLGLFILFFLIVSAAWAGISFAPWVPAWKKDLPRVFKLADLKPGEVFYDLGCGNGKVVLYAQKHFKARAIGLEISLPLFLVCKLRQLFSRDQNLIFKFKDLYKEDLSRADAVYFFGMPDKVDKLKAKLERELRPGSRVVSYVFPVEGWQQTAKDKPNQTDIAVYLYTIK